MELYLAGYGWGGADRYIYINDFLRLFSYLNDRRRAEKYICNKLLEKRGFNLMDLYLAGNTSGFPEATPQILIKDYHILLSYLHPKGPYGVDEIGKIKRKEKEMDLYLVGPEKENIMKEILGNSNLLFNYISGQKATDQYKDKMGTKKLFIDSGAFSAWTQGKEINVDEYINWLNERADFIDLYGQIDVIPGDIVKGHTQKQVEKAAEATWQNYLYMRPKMKNPDGLLYTFHIGEPYYYLEQALEWRDDKGNPIQYMAFGGMVGKTRLMREKFMDTSFTIIKDSSNPDIKVHTFGMTSFPLLEKYPIDSADSTSWIMVGANGGIMTDIGTVVVSDKQSNLPEHYSHLPKRLQDQFENTIIEFGFTLEELRHSRDNRIMFNARYINKKVDNLEYNPGLKKMTLF